jgi:hypothetical protein
MKFICRSCIEGKSKDCCILEIKGSKYLKYERPGWQKALRRCPLENQTGPEDELTGEVPIAKWVKVKKND